MIVKTKTIKVINIKFPAEPSNAKMFWKIFTKKFLAIKITLSLSGTKLLKNSGSSNFISVERFSTAIAKLSFWILLENVLICIPRLLIKLPINEIPIETDRPRTTITPKVLDFTYPSR